MDAPLAEKIFSLINQLTEDELDQVAGGKTGGVPCPKCGSYEYRMIFDHNIPHSECLNCGYVR